MWIRLHISNSILVFSYFSDPICKWNAPDILNKRFCILSVHSPSSLHHFKLLCCYYRFQLIIWQNLAVQELLYKRLYGSEITITRSALLCKTGHRIVDNQIIFKRYAEHLQLYQKRQNLMQRWPEQKEWLEC